MTNDARDAEGFVLRVQGPVVDVEFSGEVPGLYEALTIPLDK